MKELQQQVLTGERALFQAKELNINNSIFDAGESPLKHSRNIQLDHCIFKWKYPLWYSEHISMNHCVISEMGRAGIWYTKDIQLENTLIDAPKNFRRCQKINLAHVTFSHAEETLWQCEQVVLSDITAKGDYFGMNCRNVQISGLHLTGNYCFDGAENLTIRNSVLLSKDAFWNCENVTVYDSFISGEYLGWNTKNLTLINCTIESLQGLCFVENLVMKNCKLLQTTLAFEYSTVNAEITNHIDSVKNPAGGIIKALSIGEIILEEENIDPSKTEIICEGK